MRRCASSWTGSAFASSRTPRSAMASAGSWCGQASAAPTSCSRRPSGRSRPGAIGAQAGGRVFAFLHTHDIDGDVIRFARAGGALRSRRAGRALRPRRSVRGPVRQPLGPDRTDARAGTASQRSLTYRTAERGRSEGSQFQLRSWEGERSSGDRRRSCRSGSNESGKIVLVFCGRTPDAIARAAWPEPAGPHPGPHLTARGRTDHDKPRAP